MYKLDASAFHNAVVILQQTIATVQKANFPTHSDMSREMRNVSIKQLNKFKTHTEVLGCPVSSMAVNDAIGLLSGNGKFTYFQYGQMAASISNTLRNELTLQHVYVLDPSRVAYYKAEFLFGEDVSKKFPSITADIEAAGKCYACDQTTASVFHSIRCLEAGIRAIARCLAVPDPTRGADRNWSNISKGIRDKMESKWPQKTGRINGDAEIFDQLYGALAAMQNPYRNATMHLDSIYTAPDAIHLFEVVKGLMVRIAFRMDEQGHPLA